MIPLGWIKLVSNDTICDGDGPETQHSVYTTTSYRPPIDTASTLEDCASHCYGKSEMFSFAINVMDSVGCNQTHPICNCEKSVDKGGDCPQIAKNGTNLYRLTKKKNGTYYP